MTDAIRDVEQQIAASDDESKKVELMLNLIGLYFRQDLHKALATAEETYALAERVGSELQVARAVLGKGNCLYVLGHHKEALVELMAAQEKLHRLGAAFYESTAWINIGGIYAEWGDYGRSLECKLQSLRLARKSRHKGNEATALANLTATYYKSRNVERALEYCFELQSFSKGNNNAEGAVNALVYLGIIHLHSLNEIELAKEFFLQCVEAFQEGMYVGLKISALENLGDIYVRLEQYEKAEEALQQALQIAWRVGEKRLEMNSLLLLGKLCANQDDYVKALEYLSTGQNIAEELSMKEFRYAVHSEYAACYKCMGDYAKALEHYELFHAIKEEVFDEESQKKISNLTVLHDVEKAQSAKELAEKERELTHLKNVELSSALGEVRALNERLEHLNKEKNDVIGVVAHDLKSPLSGMRMVASLVKSHHTRMPVAEVEQQLEGIEQTTDRMLTIVNNLLDVHAIEAGESYAVQEEIDVVGLVERLVGEYREAAAQKGIGISIEQPDSRVVVVGSRDALQQAVANLVSNAVKFSPHGKYIVVRILVQQSNVRIEIQDEGPGMSKKEQSQLFQKFARLAAQPTGDESSTGLGLWIVKKAVDALEGRVWCESKLRKGTTFIVELPCATA